MVIDQTRKCQKVEKYNTNEKPHSREETPSVLLCLTFRTRHIKIFTDANIRKKYLELLTKYTCCICFFEWETSTVC